MKINEVKIHQIKVPLKKPFKTALRTLNVLETNIIELITDTGEVGYGEASPTPVITGDTKGSIITAVEDFIFPAIKGMEVENIENILRKIDHAMIKNSSPKAALDMAVYDLFGKFYKIPLYRFFGGSRGELKSDITVSVNAPETMAADALEYVNSGYDTLKIKVGIGSDIDIQRIAAVRKAVGPDIKIRVDANQGWGAKEAVRTIGRMLHMGLDLELVEQPVPYYDLEGLKYVTDHTEIPIMADEAMFSPSDAVNILKTRAVDILNIKLMKTGGFYNAQKIYSMAEAFGVECMIGSMMESKVGITAAAHFAAGKANIIKADLDAATLLATDPVEGGVILDGGRIVLNDGYGLGINRIDFSSAE
jgi:L-Ala-D/L-Glu epimerase